MMSSFTMTLRDAISALGGEIVSANGVTVVRGDIGLSSYPIFDEEYREILNSKIVRHYMMSEIGFETPELFRFNIETDMHEFMPYFNELYKSSRRVFDPFSTVNIRTFTEGNASQIVNASTESESATATESKSRAVQSTTPQTMLARNKDYASGGADSSGSNTSGGTASESVNSSTEDANSGESVTSGYQGLTSDMILRERETFINVDTSVINSLADNFMRVLTSGSSYSDRYTHERYGYYV